MYCFITQQYVMNHVSLLNTAVSEFTFSAKYFWSLQMCPPCGRRRNISCQDIPQIYLHVLHEFEEGNGNLLQSSCLENPRGGGAWWAAVHGVARSRTRLSDFTFTFHFHALKKEMATHSNDLAWKIPGLGEPGGLPSMGLHRVGHD